MLDFGVPYISERSEFHAIRYSEVLSHPRSIIAVRFERADV